MLPDNYSGSKFDNRKPSVKRSARHHHQQQRQRQQRDRFLFCTAVHSLRSRGERERENTKQRQRKKKKKKTNDSIRVKEGNRNEISLFPTRTTRTRARKKKKKKTKEVNDDACSLFLFLPLFRTAFFGVLRVIECVNASEVRRFLFQLTPRGKKNASRPQNACNPKYEALSRKPKDLVEKSGRKKNSHTQPIQQWA